MVKIDGNFEEVKMPARLVKGLMRLNQPGTREIVDLDKTYVKALVIALFTVKAIKDGLEMKKDMLKFMKGLFLEKI